ncbi:hypothetical protein DSBG_1891 [Desulfosporosinus sp. BG]|nr:hypothetical protein DSBG_1891 [Desulfosporosinus sp. BG]
MLAWILVLMIGGFLLGCATVITTSCYQLVKSIRRIPRKRGPLSRIVEV